MPTTLPLGPWTTVAQANKRLRDEEGDEDLYFKVVLLCVLVPVTVVVLLCLFSSPNEMPLTLLCDTPLCMMP